MPEFLSASLRHRFTWAVRPDPLRRDTVPPTSSRFERVGRSAQPAVPAWPECCAGRPRTRAGGCILTLS